MSNRIDLKSRRFIKQIYDNFNPKNYVIVPQIKNTKDDLSINGVSIFALSSGFLIYQTTTLRLPTQSWYSILVCSIWGYILNLLVGC